MFQLKNESWTPLWSFEQLDWQEHLWSLKKFSTIVYMFLQAVFKSSVGSRHAVNCGNLSRPTAVELVSWDARNIVWSSNETAHMNYVVTLDDFERLFAQQKSVQDTMFQKLQHCCVKFFRVMHLSICNINIPPPLDGHTTGIWHPPLPRE